jgi:hypothetical protein
VLVVVVAAVVEMLIAEIVEMVIADYFNWRSEAFLGSFSICGGNLENLFNPKYRSTASNI